jgi:peptide/nickel transport system substrate-binding protein
VTAYLRRGTLPSDYWARQWAKRSSRRRFLGGASAASAGVAGLALVGCGDDDDDDDVQLATPTSSGQPTATPVDPFAGAKRGGIYKLDATGDPPSLDPYGNLSFLTKGNAVYHYSRLYKYQTGPGIPPLSVRPTPDIAESAEASADGLVWTIKLRSNVNFHNVAPVNGRAVTSDDVKFSWGRATAEANGNAVQLSFVDKVEYPDKQTIKFTLKAPNAAFLDVLADTNLLFIMPTESDGGFDPAKTMIGSGPWILKDYQPSVKFVRDRNPEWYLKDFPLFDGVENAIIPDYVNRLAQFQAGNTDSSGLNAADLVTVKKALPDVQLEGRTGPTLSFTFFDADPSSPWNGANGQKVRQAISMSYDRASLLELGYNIKALKEAGLDVKEVWHNIIPAGETRWWLDPQGSDIGDAGKYYKYDPEGAKALLAEAGYPDGFDTVYQYTENRYGKTFNDIASAAGQFMAAIGVRSTTDVQDYSSKYITQTFVGNFTGIAFGYETPFPEAGSYLIRFFTDNPNNHSRVKDPDLEKLAVDQARELDEEKRKALFWDAQKLASERMWYIPNVAGAGTGFIGHQGNVRNGVEYVVKGYGGGTEEAPFRWKDV